MEVNESTEGALELITLTVIEWEKFHHDVITASPAKVDSFARAFLDGSRCRGRVRGDRWLSPEEYHDEWMKT